MAAREDTLAKLHANVDALLAELRDLNDEKLHEVFAGTWSARDILAHLGGWMDTMGMAFERMGRGERPSPEGVDLGDTEGMNARFAEAGRAKGLPAVRKDLETGLARLETGARALAADRFEEGKTALRILKTMAEHPTEHIEDVRAWKRGA